MRRKLTSYEQDQLREKVFEQLQSGQTRHSGWLGEQAPPWRQSARVIATSEDLLGSGIKRACADCGEDAYTSVQYPDDVAIVCEVCTYDTLVGKEAA
jgi:hypothetical protein